MYSNIPPGRALLGGAIVALPATLLDDEWAGRYVLLILVMYAVFNARGLQAFAQFVGRELRK